MNSPQANKKQRREEKRRGRGGAVAPGSVGVPRLPQAQIPEYRAELGASLGKIKEKNNKTNKTNKLPVVTCGEKLCHMWKIKMALCSDFVC
jgi:hypothetical protein